MNILQLNLEKSWRGGERQTLMSCLAFEQAGHQVALVARQDSPLAQKAVEQGLTVIPLKKSSSLFFFFLKAKAKHFDIVHCQTANTLSWASLFSDLFPGQLVFTRRTAFQVSPKKEKRTRLKWLKTDAFVCISQTAAQEPERLGIFNEQRPKTIIPSAVQRHAFDRIRFEQLTQPFQGKKIVAVVAALTTEKDPNTLIQAVAQLHQQRQDFVVLHFGEGVLKETCQALIQQLGLENTYHLMGFTPQMETLFAGFDVFAQSSRYEALGSSILDAFLNKVPVVATDSGGPKELLANHRGFLCPVGDSTAMANALNQCLSHPASVQTIVDNAYAYVLAEHSLQSMTTRYLDLYHHLIEQK